ncbi:50S ribosomal protein L21 [Pyruvatibacter sp.]|uniref:50S ribosomal protein L21 n=1 Tax=unclassified Pyruvatibacter TaxID=2618840 RepID=UPI002967F39A|nr:50S ribosomal protein L21 [Alphaproteobacteria bacterium]
MFAVIRTGGKQYKVAQDDVLSVEKLLGEPGDKIEISEVLMVGGDGAPKVGAPLLEGAKVSAEVVGQSRDRKVRIFKKVRRHTYRRTKGHRQHKTQIKITGISA